VTRVLEQSHKLIQTLFLNVLFAELIYLIVIKIMEWDLDYRTCILESMRQGVSQRIFLQIHIHFPKDGHDLQYLKKILKTFAYNVIKHHEDIKEILMNILFYHLEIEYFGLNSFAALFSITAIGNLNQLYELSRNANQLRWLRLVYIVETIKF